MRYKRFVIRNFKGIKELTLDLDRQPLGNVFTLVGLNESGKSTILQAIHWYHSPEAYEPVDLIPKSRLANFNGTISVECEIELSATDDAEIGTELAKLGMRKQEAIPRVAVERVFHFSNSKKTKGEGLWVFEPLVREKGRKKARPLRVTDPSWKAIVTYIRETMFPPVIYYENLLFDFPDRIPLAAPDGTALTSPYRSVIQDVLNSLAMDLKIEEHLVARRLSGTPSDLDAIQAVLDQASARITDVVITAWRDIVKENDADLEISLGSAVHVSDDGLYLQLQVKDRRQTLLHSGAKPRFSVVLRFHHVHPFPDVPR